MRVVGRIWHPAEVESGMNIVKTGLLLAALTALLGVAGYALGGAGGLALALVAAAGTNLFAYWNSDRLALSAHGAREVDAHSAPDLVALVAELAGRAGLPMPRVYVLEEAQPNAFATGRDPRNAAVAVSSGLLQALSRDEIAGVVAHELAHVRNRDTLTLTVAATLAGAVSSLAQLGLLFGGRGDGRPNPLVTMAAALLAPFAAAIIQFAVSRSREYAADRDGGLICGDPLALASALRRIEGHAQQIPNPHAERHPATAPLFIVNPLTAGGMDNLFSTHPATENRIAALRRLAAELGAAGTGGGAFAGPAALAASPWARRPDSRRRPGPWRP